MLCKGSDEGELRVNSEEQRQNQDARFVPKSAGRSGRYIIQRQSPSPRQRRPAKAGRYMIQKLKPLLAGVCGVVMAVAITVTVCAWRGDWGCEGEKGRIGRLRGALLGFFLRRWLRSCCGIVVEARHEVFARIAF